MIMQWHTGYFAANGGAIWMHWHATAWAVHDVWYCRISRSDPRPAEVCVSPNTPTQVYQGAVAGIPIPRLTYSAFGKGFFLKRVIS